MDYVLLYGASKTLKTFDVGDVVQEDKKEDYKTQVYRAPGASASSGLGLLCSVSIYYRWDSHKLGNI